MDDRQRLYDPPVTMETHTMEQYAHLNSMPICQENVSPDSDDYKTPGWYPKIVSFPCNTTETTHTSFWQIIRDIQDTEMTSRRCTCASCWEYYLRISNIQSRPSATASGVDDNSPEDTYESERLVNTGSPLRYDNYPLDNTVPQNSSSRNDSILSQSVCSRRKHSVQLYTHSIHTEQKVDQHHDSKHSVSELSSSKMSATFNLIFSSLLLLISQILRISTKSRRSSSRISSLFTFTVYSLSVISMLHALPTRRIRREDTESSDTPRVDPTSYLMKYGFLPQALLETEALRSEDELIAGIKRFQRFANLKQTGTFDNETMVKMVQPRCGVMDVFEEPMEGQSGHRYPHGSHSRPRRFVLGPSTWDKQHLTYRILNYSPDLSQRDVQDAIRRAFDVWSRVTLLDFREESNGDVDIYIKFARYYHSDGYPFDGPGMILAHAFFPGDERGGDVHFDEDEDWTLASYEGTNLFSVAAHEIGHALGLAHSDVLGALMYPWYQGYTPSFQLHYDDIDAIQYLYGRRESGIPNTPEPPRTHRPEPPRTNPPPQPTLGPATQPPWQPGTRPPWQPPTRPPTTTTRRPHHPDGSDPNIPPDPRITPVDAAANIRSELFFFMGNWFYRLNKDGLMDGYPVQINRLWYGLPEEVNRVDAVYERYGDGRIIFFKDDKYYVFRDNHVESPYQYGRPLTDFGFPPDVTKIDAVFVWGYNMKTYFVTGDMYWRYNERLERMDDDYPRDMTMWRGVRLPVGAAMRDLDGVTYFFKGSHFWEFNDQRMEIRHRKQHVCEWLDCDPHPASTSAEPGTEENQPTADRHARGDTWWIILVVLLLLVLLIAVVVAVVVWWKCCRSKRYRYKGSKFLPVKS